MISFRKRFLKLFSVMYSEERGTTKLAQIKEQEIFVNPYVVQMDKFADSLQHLSKTFLNMEAYKGTLSREEIDEMFEKVTGNVCAGCERRGECLGEKHSVTYQMMYEICLLYLVLPIAVARPYRLVPLPDPQAVFVGFFDLGELLEEYLPALLLVVGPLRFAFEKETPRAVQELLEGLFVGKLFL